MARNKQNNEIIDESVDDEPIEVVKEEKKAEEPKKSLFSSKSEKKVTRLS